MSEKSVKDIFILWKSLPHQLREELREVFTPENFIDSVKDLKYSEGSKEHNLILHFLIMYALTPMSEQVRFVASEILQDETFKKRFGKKGDK